MRKNECVTALLGLLLLASAATAGERLRVTATKSPLYSRAASDSHPLLSLEMGAELELLNRAGDWYSVRVLNSRVTGAVGVKGYVSRADVQTVPAEAEAPKPAPPPAPDTPPPARPAARPVPPKGALETPSLPTQSQITNVHVVAMVKAKMPEDLIISLIQAQPTNLETSPESLVALKTEGVSDNLIRAVVAAAASRAAQAQPVPVAQASPTVQPLEQGQKPNGVAVMDFDYGTVNNWWGQYDIGRGMADQLVNELVNDGTFRVMERKKLDTVLAEQDFSQSDRANVSAAKLSKVGAVLGVHYIIAGSITRFGTEEKSYGTAGIPLPLPGPIGWFRLKKVKTYVTLTARLIDTTTGEIVASVTGEGLSKKGGGIGLAAGSTGFLGGGGMNTSTFKESAIGEAQEGACKKLIQQLVAKKDALNQ